MKQIITKLCNKIVSTRRRKKFEKMKEQLATPVRKRPAAKSVKK